MSADVLYTQPHLPPPLPFSANTTLDEKAPPQTRTNEQKRKQVGNASHNTSHKTSHNAQRITSTCHTTRDTTRHTTCVSYFEFLQYVVEPGCHPGTPTECCLGFVLSYPTCKAAMAKRATAAINVASTKKATRHTKAPPQSARHTTTSHSTPNNTTTSHNNIT